MGNTILLADKSITIQKIVQLTFADDNYQIHCVSDGQAALEAIPHVRPDLVLADISLPLKSGYEICSAIRTDSLYSDFSAIPIILLAGIYETMDEERARQVEEKVKQVQATDFLSKPFDPQLLISKVKQHLTPDTADTISEVPMFAQDSDSAINLLDTENSASAPPDDNEKTMMLPGGPFGSMFAESLPQDEEAPSEPPRIPTDLASVNPVGEVIFEEGEFPQVELGSEEEEDQDQDQETINLPSSVEEMNQAFTGREEQEFEYSDSDVAGLSENSVPLILPDAEEPFGDVFQEPGQAVQWGSASEEDSPFGIPEPPAVPEPEPAIEPAPEFVESPLFDLPEPVEKPAEMPASEVEGFDDTWPGVPMRVSAAQPIEELFESEVSPPLTEDVEELEPDLSENMAEEQIEQASVEPVMAPAQPASPAQLTDELIDRIAERVVNKLSERVVSEIVWQVVPDLAEKMIRRELEKLHAGED
jgi:CheY-like chemotaxis protein